MKTKQIIMEKLTREAALKQIDEIKSHTSIYRAMDETPNESECYLYTAFVESVAKGSYGSLEEVIEVAKIVFLISL